MGAVRRPVELRPPRGLVDPATSRIIMPDSLRGNFLIARRTLRDLNFFHTVVFLVEHNDEGAMGVVVNRPSGTTVAEALSQHFDLPRTDDEVYIGGPVEENAMFILHNAADLAREETPVIAGIFVGSSAEVFEEAVRRSANGDAELRFRVYSGYSGWTAGQLEAELERNDWLVTPATEEFVFHPKPYLVWNLVIQKFRQTHSLAPGNLGEPEMN